MEEFRYITMITAIILSGVSQSAIVFAGSGNCELPTIKNADINITGINRFSEGTVVHFRCLPGFRPVGDGLYRCANSIWVGGNFSCLIKTCPLLESPNNGEMIGDNYEIGSVMRYKCDIGFELIGSKTSLCKMDQQWDPSNVPECQIKKCLAVAAIEHGEFIPEKKIEGFDYNDYGATLRARCESGYMINGPVRIYCDSKGKWTRIPECMPISCPSYPGLDAKCVRKTILADKTLLIIVCTANSTLISARDGTASCENNIWDDITIRCLCDCEIKADTDFVHIKNLDPNGILRHNETLEWSCKNGTTKTINDSLTCIDGTIEPQGWGCFIPSLPSVVPIDGTGSGAVVKSRNDNDDAFANLKITIIFVVVSVLVVILVLVVVCLVLKYHRGTTLKDRDTVDRESGQEARTAVTVSGTDPNGDETDPLPQDDRAEELLLPQGAGVVTPKPSQGDGAGALITSQDDIAQSKKEMSPDFSEMRTDAVSEISEVTVTDTPEIERNSPSCEEQNSSNTPTTEPLINIPQIICSSYQIHRQHPSIRTTIFQKQVHFSILVLIFVCTGRLYHVIN